MTALTIDLPLPPRDMSPNIKLHHMRRGAAVAAYREDCRKLAWSAVQVAQWTAPGRATVALVFDTAMPHRGHGPDGLYRPRDQGNAIAAAKPLLDALTLAGAIVDDDEAHMELGRIRITKGLPGYGGGVRVTVTAAPA